MRGKKLGPKAEIIELSHRVREEKAREEEEKLGDELQVERGALS